jgi:hypothetical protein
MPRLVPYPLALEARAAATIGRDKWARGALDRWFDPALGLRRLSERGVMLYEVQLYCDSLQPRSIGIEADSDSEAHEKAKAWALTLVIPAEDFWLAVLGPDGRFKMCDLGDL